MRFTKIPYEQYKKDFLSVNKINLPEDDCVLNRELEEIYDSIQMPKRQTTGSAGYDFITPYGFNLRPKDNIVICTGIRCIDMPVNVSLELYPRSGQGFKSRFALANTVGIIDSDYANANNYGHIMIKLSYDTIDPSIVMTYKNGKIVTDKAHTHVLEFYQNEMADGNKYPIGYISNDLINIEDPENFNPIKVIEAGDRIAQGLFHLLAFCDDDNATGVRIGGFGSTSMLQERTDIQC